MSKLLSETDERIIMNTLKEAYDKMNEIEDRLEELRYIVGEVCDYVKDCEKLEIDDE